jgi:hypothetical protein
VDSVLAQHVEGYVKAHPSSSRNALTQQGFSHGG